MRRSDREIGKRMSADLPVRMSGEDLQRTIRESKQTFGEGEAGDILSEAEFLLWQAKYIRKHWWLLQACVLGALWFLLEWSKSGYFVQRYMGVAASLFGVLVLPEMWKNRSSNALEVEGAAYYSLRRVYAARILLFAMVDFALLSGFSFAAVLGGMVGLEEMLVQFIFPYLVTCCICFRTLYSRRIDSEAFALFLCIVWSLVWLLILLEEKVYQTVSFPAWITLLAAAFVYLGYSVWRGQKICGNLFLSGQWIGRDNGTL